MTHRRLDDLEEARSETAALLLVPVLGVRDLTCCERMELDADAHRSRRQPV